MSETSGSAHRFLQMGGWPGGSLGQSGDLKTLLRDVG